MKLAEEKAAAERARDEQALENERKRAFDDIEEKKQKDQEKREADKLKEEKSISTG